MLARKNDIWTLFLTGLAALPTMSTEAFVVGMSRRQTRAFVTMRKDSEASEWYSPPIDVALTSTRKPGTLPLERTIDSIEDFDLFVRDEDDGRLTVIVYHASWCRSCARFNIHMEKLVSQTADWVYKQTGELDRHGSVRYGSVEWNANSDLCEREDIETLPTTRFYRDGNLVHEVTGGTKNFPRVKELIAYHTAEATTTIDASVVATTPSSNAPETSVPGLTLPLPEPSSGTPDVELLTLEKGNELVNQLLDKLDVPVVEGKDSRRETAR